MMINGTKEEIQRGLVWSPNFGTRHLFDAAGSDIRAGSVVVQNGLEFVTSSGQCGVAYTQRGNHDGKIEDNVSFIIEFVPTWEANDNTTHFFFNDSNLYHRLYHDGSDNAIVYEDYYSNEIRISLATYGAYWRINAVNQIAFSMDTSNGHNAFLNGQQILTADATSYEGFRFVDFMIGADYATNYPVEAKYNFVKLFSVSLESQELSDYWTKSNYTYNDGATVLLPCDMRNHDPDAGVARDVSKKRNDFTIAGGLEKIDNGFGYRGNGTDAYLVNDSPVVSMTTPWWVALKILNCDDRIFSNGSTSLSDPYLVLRVVSGSLLVRMDNDADTTILAETSAFDQLEDGNAHTIIFGDNLGDACLYIDGVEDSTDFSYTPAGTLTLNIAALFCLYQSTPGGYSNGDVLDHRAKQGEIMTPLKAKALHNEMMGRVGRV